MQTSILPELREDPDVRLSEQVLRSCVHCGFCNATCPTYLLTGNELEGPRGRIYLIKSLLEGRVGSGRDHRGLVTHIDNCLGCLACETTCPSGVVYSRLLEDARPRLEETYPRRLSDRLVRMLLTLILPYPRRFRLAVRLGRLSRALAPLMPRRYRHLADMAPTTLPRPPALARPGVIAAEGERAVKPVRRVALLTGCVQEVMGSHINDATVRLLTRLGIEVSIPEDMGCCGALTYHMGERRHSLALMARNIRVWHEEIDTRGVDAIVLNTSGCATVAREYGHIFRNDPQLAAMAETVAAHIRDVSEVVSDVGLCDRVDGVPRLRVAYHDACSLQHGQSIGDQPRTLLRDAGFEVVEVPDAHLCCGSAGTYSILRPEFAGRLRDLKGQSIRQVSPQVVAAGNIGCIEHIAQAVDTPVTHTVELLDWATGGPAPLALTTG